MISLLLGISVICTIIFLIIYVVNDSEGFMCAGILSGACAAFLLVWTCVLWNSVATDGELLPQKIAMYEEENAQLEEQIAVTVNAYMQHEATTYEEILSENSINIALTLPELQSNEMVQQQIKIYMNNTEQIKALKNQLIELGARRWRLYFGR